MKILLDEQLPVKLKYRFEPELNVSTVRDEQWLGIKNGELIQRAVNAGFTVLITNDQNLGFQQKLIQFKILFIDLHQPSNRYEDILPVMIAIKQWLIKIEANIEKQIEEKNYLIYPTDFSAR
jgi:predicted nuclease of predicted toxin-antitoxin system